MSYNRYVNFSFYSGHLPDLWRLQKEIDPEVSLTVAVDFWYVCQVSCLEIFILLLLVILGHIDAWLTIGKLHWMIKNIILILFSNRGIA